MDFSEKLREIAKNYGISINQFKEKTGIDTRSVYAYFNGESIPTLKNLMRIIEVFPNLSLEWLLRDTGDMLLNAEPVDTEEVQQMSEIERLRLDFIKSDNNRLSIENQELRNKVSRLEARNEQLQDKLLAMLPK